MKNKISSKTLLYFVLTLFPLLIVFILFPILPERIPAHYNISGEIDRWGTRYGSFIIPAIIIIIAMIFQLLKLTKNKVANAKAYFSISLVILLYFNLVNFIFLYNCFYPVGLGIGNLFGSALSILVICLGNFFPKLKQNNFVGIKLYWTLNNETVWYKTHRLGGFVWVVGGSIMLPLCLFVSTANSILIWVVGLAIITIIPSVYSYIIYKKLSDNP